MKIKKIRRFVSKMVSSFYDRALAPPTQLESSLVEELRTDFKSLPICTAKSSQASEAEWMNNMLRLKELVLNDDPREFLRWDVIIKTMAVTNAEYTRAELRHLQSLPDWDGRWCKAVVETPAGHPVPYWRYPKSSENLIHHAYHISQFEEKTGLRIEQMKHVFEFGGGYGGMCRLVRNLGFGGKYILFDLPAFSILQRCYLKCLGAKVCTPDSFKTVQTGITCISDIDKLEELLTTDVDPDYSMFLATWSISETPVELRNLILPLVSDYGAFLVAYQQQFQEVNNVDFFRGWTAAGKNVEWHDWSIEHVGKGNRYLTGRRVLERC